MINNIHITALRGLFHTESSTSSWTPTTRGPAILQTNQSMCAAFLTGFSFIKMKFSIMYTFLSVATWLKKRIVHWISPPGLNMGTFTLKEDSAHSLHCCTCRWAAEVLNQFVQLGRAVVSLSLYASTWIQVSAYTDCICSKKLIRYFYFYLRYLELGFLYMYSQFLLSWKSWYLWIQTFCL